MRKIIRWRVVIVFSVFLVVGASSTSPPLLRALQISDISNSSNSSNGNITFDDDDKSISLTSPPPPCVCVDLQLRRPGTHPQQRAKRPLPSPPSAGKVDGALRSPFSLIYRVYLGDHGYFATVLQIALLPLTQKNSHPTSES